MRSTSSLRKRTGCLGWGLRILLAGIVLLVILLGVGFTSQVKSTAADFQQIPAPGQLVDVGGHRMHVFCQGEGNPTVIVDTGLGDFSVSWSQVQLEVARFSRICMYDRAGYGWSDPSPARRTAQPIALELHTLLDKSSIEGPYILVGHSLGGLDVRMYASLYPEEVVGMVLVDAMHEDVLTRFPTERAQMDQQQMATWGVMKLMAQFGILRVMGESASEQSLPAYIKQLPADQQQVYMTLLSHPSYFQAAQGEMQLIGESCKQVSEIGDLGELPLVVLTAEKSQDIEALRVRPVVYEQTQIVWQTLQKELVSLSTNSTHVMAEGSGHFVHLDRPDLVIAAIRQLIDQN